MIGTANHRIRSQPFDIPGQTRTKPPTEESPECEWNRQPNERVPCVPDEDIPFDKPGQLNSIPHTKQPEEGGPDDDD
jgi:hypothetical protein